MNRDEVVVALVKQAITLLEVGNPYVSDPHGSAIQTLHRAVELMEGVGKDKAAPTVTVTLDDIQIPSYLLRQAE